MKVLIFGATGMVGQGVLRECLLDPEVTDVQTIGRTPTNVKDAKLYEIVHADMFRYVEIETQLVGFDACFFCLGVSSASISGPEYERLTYSLTMAAAGPLARLNPGMTFVYVSGAGTDSSELGPVRWARVKGKTENALLRQPFRAAYMFRPGVIVPVHGEVSKVAAYRFLYMFTKPVLPLLQRLFPQYVITTAQLGRAMIHVARSGFPEKVLESPDIRACA